MHRRKVLVSGANGLLGANVCNELSKNGYDVRAFIRKGSNCLAIEDLDCEIKEGDITIYAELEDAVKNMDYVIHCAAQTTQFPNSLEAYRRVNIDVVLNLLHICKAQRVKRFIQVSTTNCFTNGSIHQPGNEEGDFMPWLRKSGYAYSKYLAQKAVIDEGSLGELETVCVAPSFLIGPRDAKLSSGKLLMISLHNRLLFYPPGGKSFVAVEEVSQAIKNAIEIENPDKCYILSGENLSYRDFFKKVRRISGKTQLLIPIPRIFLTFMALFIESLSKIFQVSLPLTRVNQKLLCLDNYFFSEKARNELQFRETNIDDAIQSSISWFAKNGYLK